MAGLGADEDAPGLGVLGGVDGGHAFHGEAGDLPFGEQLGLHGVGVGGGDRFPGGGGEA